MKYTKIPIGSYNLHLIENNKFKEVNILIDMKRKANKKDYTKRKVLGGVLAESSKLYPTNRLMLIEMENLYNLYFNISDMIVGSVHSLTFNATYLSNKYTDLNQNENVIKFISEIIFNPDIINNKFRNDKLRLVKNIVLENIEKYDEDVICYSMERLEELVDTENRFFYKSPGYLEDLNEIDETNLYDYYKDIIKNDDIDIFVTGNFDSEEMKELISKYIYFNNNSYNEIDFNIKPYNKKEALEVIEAKDTNQSWLVLGYTTNNFSLYEQVYVSKVYSVILGGGGSSKLFSNVREKKSLCYMVGSNIQILKNLMVIRAGINSSDYKSALEEIKKQVSEMSKGNITMDEVEGAKQLIISGAKKSFGDIIGIRNRYMQNVYFNFSLLDEFIKNIKKVKTQDLIDLSKKIHLNTIYLLEGSIK